MKLSLGKIAEFVSAVGEFPREQAVSGYSIDSRSVGAGQIFFAVKGERLDGHDFVGEALEKGAVAAVVRKDQLGRYPGKTRLLAVEDTLAALQTLATAVRKLWGKPLIAVTGSAGKTTTKEAIAHVLGTRFGVLKSEGNFNNHFGLPLMLLKLEPQHAVAVIEMGMSHAGEIRALARIAQPEIGVVTNVAPVHLEFFDSIADIARAKYELIESLPASGTAVLNADDQYVSQFARGFKGKKVMYGTHPSADKRGQVLQVGNITVINDCYNSNPTALNAMVDALAAMPAQRRIVIAGEMLELGPAGEEMHRAAGKHVAGKRIDVLVGVRGLAQAMVNGASQAGTRAEFMA